MAGEEKAFRQFMTATREKALELIDQEHISNDARTALKDFIEVMRQTEKLLEARTELNADQRILQKRYEALKSENRELLSQKEQVKTTIITELAPIVKEFTSAAVAVSDRAEKMTDETVKRDLSDASLRVRMTVKRLIDVLSKI